MFQPVANPIPYFKGVHESYVRWWSVYRTNLHMHVGYAQRDISVECQTSFGHGCVVYLLLPRKGGTTMMVVFPEKRVCVFNTCVTRIGGGYWSSDQHEVWAVLFWWVLKVVKVGTKVFEVYADCCCWFGLLVIWTVYFAAHVCKWMDWVQQKTLKHYKLSSDIYEGSVFTIQFELRAMHNLSDEYNL